MRQLQTISNEPPTKTREEIQKEVRSQNFKLGYRQESPDAECVQEKHVYEEKLKKYFNETISINRNMI
jgi:hypothetical protein